MAAKQTTIYFQLLLDCVKNRIFPHLHKDIDVTKNNMYKFLITMVLYL